MIKLNSTIMKQVLFSNWNFMRFLRLGLGIAIIVQSVIAGNWTMGILGLLFTAMPVFNIGCCGTSGCSTPTKKTTETTKDISYEEVV
jgi:hypothetical protein